MFSGYIHSSEYKNANNICQYIVTNPKLSNLSCTHHEYEENVPENIKESIAQLKYGSVIKCLYEKYPESQISPITEMNELYISYVDSDGSDKVFETPHIDGIFYFLPWCKIYRCILAIQGNKTVSTNFPTINVNKILKTGDFLGFDYNRDIHYIQQIQTGIADTTPRIIIKLHYIVVPKNTKLWLIEFYKKINIRYNDFMRMLFLKSQGKKNRVLSFIINTGTQIYAKFFGFFE